MTVPAQLDSIDEGSGGDEDPAQQRSCEEEDGGEHRSAVLDLQTPELPPGDSLRSEVEARFQDFLLPAEIGSRPSTPPTTGTCAKEYLVDLASSGDDRGSAPTPASGAIVPIVSPKCTPPRSPLRPILNAGNCTPVQCNPESPEEALDRLIASLPTPACLRWLSTRAQHVNVSFFCIQPMNCSFSAKH